MALNFGDLPENFSDKINSKICLLTVPYDKTTSWLSGTYKGPSAFLEASANMELFDIETSSEIYKKGVYVENLDVEKLSPSAMTDAVYSKVNDFLKMDKFLTLFGGEHSISIGSIRAFSEKYKNLSVLQLDAHSDLRKEYGGTKYSHACAMYEASMTTNLVQVGIRSMDISERGINDENIFFAEDMNKDNLWVNKSLDKLTDDVYISLDVDVLDPSIMPSTGTPEPGGMLWYEIINYLRLVFERKNVVGFDIVELSPNSTNKSPDFLCSKLYYKMITYKFL